MERKRRMKEKKEVEYNEKKKEKKQIIGKRQKK